MFAQNPIPFPIFFHEMAINYPSCRRVEPGRLLPHGRRPASLQLAGLLSSNEFYLVSDAQLLVWHDGQAE